jgi:hypothetical protein
MHENAAVQERVLADLEQLARPRHARWDELGGAGGAQLGAAWS